MKATTTNVIWLAAALVLLLASPGSSLACDTWVALKDATRCGQTILAKNSDRPCFDCQPLMFHPRQAWPSGSEVNLGRVTIPQVKETIASLGSSPYWCWGYEEGINEYGVAIGNEAIRTKVLSEEIVSYKAGNGPKLGPTGMDLLRLGLERGKTARESLQVIGGLVERYGQFGSGAPTAADAKGAYHNSYIIADPKEAWVLETTGTHWVAKRVPKGWTSISNEVCLGHDYDLASPRLVEYAVSSGFLAREKTGLFDFKAAYATPGSSSGHIRAMRSRDLLGEKAGSADLRWMMRIARDRGRSPSIDQGGTASSCIAILPDSPDQIPVFWWCPSIPSDGCYVPFFVHGSGLPEVVSAAGTHGRRIEPPSAVQKDGFRPQSYWWLFRDLSDKVESDREHRNPLVRKAFDPLEKQFAAETPEVLKRAVQLRRTGHDAQAANLLASFSSECVNKVLARVGQLRERLR